jgi:hypothetical protein
LRSLRRTQQAERPCGWVPSARKAQTLGPDVRLDAKQSEITTWGVLAPEMANIIRQWQVWQYTWELFNVARRFGRAD